MKRLQILLLALLMAFSLGIARPPTQDTSHPPLITATEIVSPAIPPWENPPKVLHTPPLVATLPEDALVDISKRLRRLVVVGTLPSGGMPA